MKRGFVQNTIRAEGPDQFSSDEDFLLEKSVQVKSNPDEFLRIATGLWWIPNKQTMPNTSNIFSYLFDDGWI
jgi:hypothetical protein